MFLKDRYGNASSTASSTAMAHYNNALDLIRLYRGDPIAALDAALAEDPDFGGAWAAPKSGSSRPANRQGLR
jgi:hypothetical protein